MQIVIADPDEPLATVLAFVARRRGHKAVTVSDVREVLESLPVTPAACFLAADQINDAVLGDLRRIRDEYPDALLYLMLDTPPGVSGIAAREQGAADLVTKPFFPHEVILRAEIDAASRINNPSIVRELLSAGDIEVELDRYAASKNGEPLSLTKLELRLLHCLIEHAGRLAPTERLLSFGWETQEPPYPSLLKTHISHLRRKLQKAGGAPVYIRARHSLGYVLTVDSPVDGSE